MGKEQEFGPSQHVDCSTEAAASLNKAGVSIQSTQPGRVWERERAAQRAGATNWRAERKW